MDLNLDSTPSSNLSTRGRLRLASCTWVQAYRGRMNQMLTLGPGDPGWVDVEACTLPTAERPLRLAEFDDLFTALESIERSGDTHARLLLVGDHAFAVRAQRLADAETACCSFFTFGVSTVEDGFVALDIHVPAAHAEVLGGLVARAEAVQAAT